VREELKEIIKAGGFKRLKKNTGWLNLKKLELNTELKELH
jgi:hypothetical protein